MDFKILFQLRDKRFWWMDVIFYFVVSLLIATVFCYVIFLIKNSIQREDIKETIVALETVGTEQQKEYEKTVISYQKKIIDFTKLFKNHEFASHVFGFMQEKTMPNIWFKQFGLDKKNSKVQLLGEADDMESFSRQVAHFERNENVKNVGTLNSALGEFAKIQFNLNLVVDPKLFGYVPEIDEEEEVSLETVVSDSSQPIFEQGMQKLITVFDLLLSPEIIGRVDHTNYTIDLDVPYQTDITNLKPLIIISTGATVSPESGVFQDFTNPVIYRVTAKDGSSQEYTATVNVLSNAGEESGQSGIGVILTIVASIITVVAVIFGAFFIYRKRLKNKKQID